MTTTTELKIDVGDAAGQDRPAEIAATVFAPDTLREPPIVCFAFPGGGYSRHYYGIDLPERSPGGQAAWHARRGWIVVTVDHLQVGESTVFEPDLLTLETVTAANQAVVETVLGRLAAGDVDGLPAVSDPFTVGIGQSMGGCFTLVLQGRHRVFDAVGILGYSAIHTVVPTRPGSPPLPLPWISRIGYPSAPVVLNPDALPDGDDEVTVAAADPTAEHPWTWAFHHEAEPQDLVAEDMAAMSGGPVPRWRSATTPACAILMVAPGAVATEAAAITTPVLIAVGERDVVPDPWREPGAYRSSPDVTLAVYPTMAHMHNFAPTREQLWTRIHGWAETAAAVAGRGPAPGGG